MCVYVPRDNELVAPWYPQIYKGDPRTCTIFIPAWGSNWGFMGFPAIEISVICQVRMYCGLNVKINTRETPHSTQKLWTHLFAFVSICVCGRKILIPPILAPWLTKHGVIYKVWDLPCISVVVPDILFLPPPSAEVM